MGPPSNCFIRKVNDSCITPALQRLLTLPSPTAQTHLCKDGSSSLSCSGSLVLGITPMMVLFSEVPFSSLLLTNCMFLAVSTLILIVEPGNSTPSWVHSKGSRLGIWIPLLDDILQGLERRLKFITTNRSELRCKERLHRMTNGTNENRMEAGTTAAAVGQSWCAEQTETPTFCETTRNAAKCTLCSLSL